MHRDEPFITYLITYEEYWLIIIDPCPVCRIYVDAELTCSNALHYLMFIHAILYS